MDAKDYIDRGKQASQTGDFQRAYECFVIALSQATRDSDSENELSALGLLSDVFLKTGQHKEAFSLAGRMRDRAISLNNIKQFAFSLGYLANVYLATKQIDNAVELLEQELAIVQGAGDKVNEAIALSNLAGVYRITKDPIKGLSCCRRLIDISLEIKDFHALGLGYLELAMLQRTRNLNEAISASKAAVEIFQQIDEKMLGVAKSLHDDIMRNLEYAVEFNRCALLLETGELQDATNGFEELLQKSRQNDDRSNEGICLLGLSVAYGKQGYIEKQQKFVEEGFQILNKLEDLENKLTALNSFCVVLNRAGVYDLAIMCLNDVIEQSKTNGLPGQEMSALITLANVYSNQREFRKAIEFAELGLDKAVAVEDKMSTARLLGNLSTYHSEYGNFEGSLDYARAALQICREIGDQTGEGSQLWNQAFSLANLGRLEEAVEIARQSLALREKINDPRAEKVRMYLRIWDSTLKKNQGNKGPKVSWKKPLIEAALGAKSIDDFIEDAFNPLYSYGYSDTVWFINYLYRKVLPTEFVNALFDEELFAIADSQILQHPRLRISMEEYKNIWECFVYATEGDEKGFNLSDERLLSMMSRQREWVIALLILGIIVPMRCEYRQVSYRTEFYRGYQEFLQTDIAKLFNTL